MITAATRVADALAERPDLRDVLPAFHPAFARLNHPVLGRVLPKLVTVADAARIAGVDVDALVAVMNCPVGATTPVAVGASGAGPARSSSASCGSSASVARRGADTPAPDWHDAARVSTLDARPILDAGEDPLARILAAIRALPAGGQLTVIAPFEPVPLVGLLGRQGWRAWTRWEGEACHVTFGRDPNVEGRRGSGPRGSGGGVERGSVAGGVAGGDTVAVAATPAGDGWVIDVRSLAPPEPMRCVLAALDAGRLPLRVLHAREPALLYPHLVERGLAWSVSTAPEAVVIDVRRG